MQEELLSLKTIEKSLAVFCLATYGEGDPTDNAMEFWDWIQGDVDLTGLNYAVSEKKYSNSAIYKTTKKYIELFHLPNWKPFNRFHLFNKVVFIKSSN